MKRGFVFNVFRVILVILVIGTSARAKIYQDVIEDIEIRGYRTVTSEEIRKNIQSKPGDPYDPEQVKRDFEKVLDMGIFDKAECKLKTEKGVRGGVIVIFLLKEISKDKGQK